MWNLFPTFLYGYAAKLNVVNFCGVPPYAKLWLCLQFVYVFVFFSKDKYIKLLTNNSKYYSKHENSFQLYVISKHFFIQKIPPIHNSKHTSIILPYTDEDSCFHTPPYSFYTLSGLFSFPNGCPFAYFYQGQLMMKNLIVASSFNQLSRSCWKYLLSWLEPSNLIKFVLSIKYETVLLCRT